MKKTYLLTMKKVLLIALLAGGGMGIISCSKECEDDAQQAVSISLTTINENGENATVFSSKENILFDLSIKNSTNDTIFLDEPFLLEIVHSFKLYSFSDVFVGYPFDGIDMLKFQDTLYYLMPYESRHWLCMYMTHQSEIDLKSPLESNMIKEPLSHGEYYLLYSLTLNKETKTGKTTFIIE